MVYWLYGHTSLDQVLLLGGYQLNIRLFSCLLWQKATACRGADKHEPQPNLTHQRRQQATSSSWGSGWAPTAAAIRLCAGPGCCLSWTSLGTRGPRLARDWPYWSQWDLQLCYFRQKQAWEEAEILSLCNYVPWKKLNKTYISWIEPSLSCVCVMPSSFLLKLHWCYLQLTVFSRLLKCSWWSHKLWKLCARPGASVQQHT